MEFKEFSNPESKDYDITSSFEMASINRDVSNPYVEQLIGLIGVLEDVTEEELQNKYGISINEYFNPTAETIFKVCQKVDIEENIIHR